MKPTLQILLIVIALALLGCGPIKDLYLVDDEGDIHVQNNSKVLKILSIWPEDSDNGKLIVELTEQYIQEENPDFDYEYELVSVENLDRKLATLVASDDLPDVFVYDSGVPLKQLVEANVLLDIGQALKDMGADKYLDDSAVELLKSISDTTSIYDLPLGLNVEGFWYNKELFAQAGVEVPETWDDMLKVCETLLTKGIQPISAGGSDKWPLTRLINAYAYRSMGKDVMDRAANGEIDYTDPGLIEAADMIWSMAMKGYFGDNVTTVDQGTAGDLLLSGEAAMFYNGSWFTENLVSEANPAGDDGIGFFSVPLVDPEISDTHEYPMNCGNILAMDRKKYDDQTADWLYYFVSHIGDLAMEEFGAVKGYQYAKEKEMHPYSLLVAETLNQVEGSTKWFEASMDTLTKDAAHTGVVSLVNGEITGRDYMQMIEDASEGSGQNNHSSDDLDNDD